MPKPPAAPVSLGHYRIVSPLGAGGMGEVYLATDTRLSRNVAIKVLPASTTADEEGQRRMLREARLIATIEHPNVCTIYEIGEEKELPGHLLGRRLAVESIAPGSPIPTLPPPMDHVVGGLAAGLEQQDVIFDTTETAREFGVALTPAETVLRRMIWERTDLE